LRDLLQLKRAWPHRPQDAPGPCHFPFDNGLYHRPPIAWPTPERPDALYQTLFEELESRFATAQDVSQAVTRLDQHFTIIGNAMG
jgi:hypothetical protein